MLTAAADTDLEVRITGETAHLLPVFSDYGMIFLSDTLPAYVGILNDVDGLDHALAFLCGNFTDKATGNELCACLCCRCHEYEWSCKKNNGCLR